MDIGPCFGMNGHFRRDPEVISRLPDTTIHFLSVFIGFRCYSSLKLVILDQHTGFIWFLIEKLKKHWFFIFLRGYFLKGLSKINISVFKTQNFMNFWKTCFWSKNRFFYLINRFLNNTLKNFKYYWKTWKNWEKNF